MMMDQANSWRPALETRARVEKNLDGTPIPQEKSAPAPQTREPPPSKGKDDLHPTSLLTDVCTQWVGLGQKKFTFRGMPLP